MTVFLVVGNCQMVFAETSSKNGSAKIMNGPYLLAPKPDSMTVAFETDNPVDAWINYGTDGKLTSKVKIKYELGTDFKNAKTYYYRATLKGLKSETLYNYSVELAAGSKEAGSFKTFSKDPKKIKFLVISDTHKFESEKYFEEMIAKSNPDFILHTGDMVEGTGLQKDQFSYWLQGGAEFLKNIPVIYANGNHDDGPYYDDYFSIVQKKEFNSDATGRNISFNYSGVHFIMMDSSPWGLYEMNAVTSGGKVDEKTKKLISDSIKWLEDDLKSDSAKNAQFRILGMHHPYFDDFTQKNVVDILEKYNVNVVFSGHLHEYNRNVSINPKVGSKTVYITQGDGRIADGKISYGKDGERINEAFPEVVATGKGDFISVTVEDGKLQCENFGFDGKETKVFDKMTLSSEEPKLLFSNVSIGPVGIKVNSNVTIKATVKNEGVGTSAVVMNVLNNDKENSIYLFGEKGKERVVVLNPGESKELTTEMPVIGAGNHKLKLGDYKQNVIAILRPAEYEYANLKTKLGEGKDSDTLYVKADVRNVGSVKGTEEVKLYINNEATISKKVEFTSLQRKTVEFVYKFNKSGSYDVKINDTASQKIDIEGNLRGTPIIKDLSGNGNNAFLRGAPKLIKTPNGVAVDLDGIDDYIEIPDSELFRYKDGLTGMVWSSIDKLAGPDEYDHNPLLVKGPSVSYGVNYLYRMALRKTGKLTYGVGFDNDNGEFFWNDEDNGGAKIGEWAQYTGAFDMKTGGTSYLDNTKVGEIQAPSYDSPIKNWEGYPIFCGYSYHKQLLKNRGRGKYYTMLDAKVGQIRYYTTKLEQEDVKYINEHPDEKGPKADKLAVWLNFEDLDTKGTHITEWRRPAEFTPNFKKSIQAWDFTTLEVDADVQGKSSLKAVVEVSDDGNTVKGSKEISLKDGKQTIDISNIPKAQFVRIKTEFNSYVSTDGTFIPEIKEYKLSATNDTSNVDTTWSTRADWEKGTLNGAAGFESTDRFKNYEEDFGNY
ncbi:MAG: putative phosphodiesterase [Clostridium sp.]|jgi:predicted phosphodiesterase